MSSLVHNVLPQNGRRPLRPAEGQPERDEVDGVGHREVKQTRSSDGSSEEQAGFIFSLML